jgi:hypothetical protein
LKLALTFLALALSGCIAQQPAPYYQAAPLWQPQPITWQEPLNTPIVENGKIGYQHRMANGGIWTQ